MAATAEPLSHVGIQFRLRPDPTSDNIIVAPGEFFVDLRLCQLIPGFEGGAKRQPTLSQALLGENADRFREGSPQIPVELLHLGLELSATAAGP